jgi:hypothetical protein
MNQILFFSHIWEILPQAEWVSIQDSFSRHEFFSQDTQFIPFTFQIAFPALNISNYLIFWFVFSTYSHKKLAKNSHKLLPSASFNVQARSKTKINSILERKNTMKRVERRRRENTTTTISGPSRYMSAYFSRALCLFARRELFSCYVATCMALCVCG